MKSIIIIPSRLASTRLPNKPLIDIGGKPMIVRVLESARRSNIQDIVIATPDIEIAEVVKKAGGEYVLTSDHHHSGTDRIMEALRKLDPFRNIETVINLQGDLPFISPEYINSLETIIKINGVDIGTLISYLSENNKDDPNIVKVAMNFKDEEKVGKAVYFSREPIPWNSLQYYQHIGIYVYKRETIERFCLSPPGVIERVEKLEQLRALGLGMNIFCSLVENPPIGIDTQDDLHLLENKLSDLDKKEN